MRRSGGCASRMRYPVLIWMFLGLLLGSAQILPLRADQKWPLMPPRSPVLVEIFKGMPADDGSTQVELHMHVSRRFIVFSRSQDAGTGSTLTGRVDITVEILDSLDNSVARFLRQRGTTADAGDAPGIDQHMSFRLAPGTYRIIIDVRDSHSNRRFYEDTRLLTIPPSFPNAPAHTDVLFGILEPAPRARFIPFNFGGAVKFGSQASIAVGMKWSDVNFPVRLQVLMSSGDASVPGNIGSLLLDTLVDHSTFRGNQLVQNTEADAPEYLIANVPDSSIRLVLFTVPDGLLYPGSYHLRITTGQAPAQDSMDHPFNVRWSGVPSSLSNSDIAIAAMEHVMTPDEYKGLKSSPEDSLFARFDRFWKEKDPQPGTAVNEALLEYYRRVDSAREKFSDIRGKDGLRTDRGRAYILYGPPASVDRILDPGVVPREIWDYPWLARRLVFEDIHRRGEYVFVRIEGGENTK